MVMKEPCPFCGSRVGHSTKEHWLPRDWGEHFPLPPAMLARRVDYHDQVSEPMVKNLAPYDQQFSGICAACDGGWLRELDTAAKPIALSLGLRRVAAVPAAEVVPLAASLYRAALMLTWGRRVEQGYEPSRFQFLHAHRRPPEDVFILLGKAMEPWIHGGGYQNVLPVARNIDALRIITFGAIGHLWVAVIDPAPGFESEARYLAASAKTGTSGTLKQLWPNRRRTRVTLDGMRIGVTVADRVAGVHPLTNDSEPFAPAVTPDSVLARYPTEPAYRDSFRASTKTLE